MKSIIRVLAFLVAGSAFGEINPVVVCYYYTRDSQIFREDTYNYVLDISTIEKMSNDDCVQKFLRTVCGSEKEGNIDKFRIYLHADIAKLEAAKALADRTTGTTNYVGNEIKRLLEEGSSGLTLYSDAYNHCKTYGREGTGGFGVLSGI